MVSLNIISLMESIKIIVSVFILIRLINVFDSIIKGSLWFDNLLSIAELASP